MRSDTCMTMGMSCSTKRMVTPEARTASTSFMTFALSLVTALAARTVAREEPQLTGREVPA